MATYVTKKCPHCGYAYQIHQSGEQRKYGCPFRVCLKCNRAYYDDDIKEPALYGFNNAYEVFQSIRTAIAGILVAAMGVASIGFGIYLLDSSTGIVALIIGGLILLPVISHIRGKIKERKEREMIIARQRKEYDESFLRLKDTQYLESLAKFDGHAKSILMERRDGKEEHYAKRP